jgi:transposase
MLYNNNCIGKLLGLEDANAKFLRREEGKCFIEIKMDLKVQACPRCGNTTKKVHDYRKQVVKDAPIHWEHTVLILHKRRYVCGACSKRFAEEISFLPKYHRGTTRLFAGVLNQCAKSKPFKEIARETGLSQTTVSRVFDKVNYGKSTLSKVLSFDEFRGNAGGEKFQFILTDPENRNVLDILPDRRQETLYKYFSGFLNRKDVNYVVIDMSRVYRDVVKTCFPNAKIVIDKFHVIRQVLWAFDRVRKEEQKKFTDDRRVYFKRSRTLFMKKPEKITEAQSDQLNAMLHISERLRKAYAIVNEFREFMKSENSKQARKALGRFMMMQNYNLPEFDSVFRMISNWDKYILNAFDVPYTNGYTEGINNKIKVLKRISYGMRNFDRFRNRILHMMFA